MTPNPPTCEAANRVHRLALIIGLAVLLTCSAATAAGARCVDKAQLTNQAIADVEHAAGARQVALRRTYTTRGYESLARAWDQPCSDAELSAKWTVVEAWLGAYQALEKVSQRKGTAKPACRALFLAEARQGVVLSWVELASAQERWAQTNLYKKAASAAQEDALALSMTLPPLAANQKRMQSFVQQYADAEQKALRPVGSDCL